MSDTVRMELLLAAIREELKKIEALLLVLVKESKDG